MRLSFVIFASLIIVLVNAAALAAQKPPATRSAYAYLRRVRGTKSCNGTSCPFWQRHGRSFVSLRCYSQEYQDCTCLHRMCYRSCMFTQQVCDQEMVHCLRQICPRCMPASAAAMCPVYDSMAQSVAAALSSFSCYACCPPSSTAGNSSTSSGSMTVHPPAGDLALPSTTPMIAAGSTTPPNGMAMASTTPVNGGVINGGAGLNGLSAGNGVANGAATTTPSQNQRVKGTRRTTRRRVTTTRPKGTTSSNRRVRTGPQQGATKRPTVKKTQATRRPKN